MLVSAARGLGGSPGCSGVNCRLLGKGRSGREGLLGRPRLHCRPSKPVHEPINPGLLHAGLCAAPWKPSAAAEGVGSRPQARGSVTAPASAGAAPTTMVSCTMAQSLLAGSRAAAGPRSRRAPVVKAQVGRHVPPAARLQASREAIGSLAHAVGPWGPHPAPLAAACRRRRLPTRPPGCRPPHRRCRRASGPSTCPTALMIPTTSASLTPHCVTASRGAGGPGWGLCSPGWVLRSPLRLLSLRQRLRWLEPAAAGGGGRRRQPQGAVAQPAVAAAAGRTPALRARRRWLMCARGALSACVALQHGGRAEVHVWVLPSCVQPGSHAHLQGEAGDCQEAEPAG